MRRLLIFLTCYILLATCCLAQIVTLTPAFPDRDEVITITYDATQGSGGLIGETQVYMHTGLITEASTSGSDWKYVVGNWGTDDPRVKMTNIGNNLHQISLVINDFYNVPADEMIDKLAFVFRNVDGSKEGKTAQFGDIFLDYTENEGFAAQLLSPTVSNVLLQQGGSVDVLFSATQEAEITIKDNGLLIYQEMTDMVNYTYTVMDDQNHQITISASYEGEIIEATFLIVVVPQVTIQSLPTGSKYGINKIDESTYRLVLLAPQKSTAYVIGDFNDWQIDNDYFMKRTPEGDAFWIDIKDLSADQNYAFQYLVDGTIAIADPFSELVLDPSNDPWISQTTFADLHPYPEGHTTGYVSLLRTGSEDYVWEHTIEAPAKEDLVIYEILMRDFTTDHNYQALLDTLDYLDNLGINAIELMPINEFEGNQSWGYNPSFHMALDKYYGTPAKLKEVIDECHRRGIAVILDVVYNHAFSQSPLAKLYWDPINFRPSEDSPFLNVTARHPYNVGYDFNHESIYTQSFVKRVTQYWLEEYHIDGFRFDLSKGFTQRSSTDDGTFASYDQGRIDILKQYAADIWSVNPQAYVILEHFAANDEEKELAEHGMMLWSNHNYNFNEATMGYNTDGKSNFEWIDYQKKGWNAPRAIGYMESHDEERLMYKNLEYGNGAGSYQVTDLQTALERIELATVFFFAMPGPKMLWQFGEMGYDFSINRCEDGTISDDCRLSPKPVRWDYKEDVDRKKLLDITQAMIHLKTDHAVTHTDDYRYDVTAETKHLILNGQDMKVAIVGNFDVINQEVTVTMPSTGVWHNYLTGDSVMIESQEYTFVLDPGAYLVLTDQALGTGVISGIDDPAHIVKDHKVAPHPAAHFAELHMTLARAEACDISIIDSHGVMLQTIHQILKAGANQVPLDIHNIPSGWYHVIIQSDTFRLVDRLIIQK